MGVNKDVRICFVYFSAYPLFNRMISQAYGGSEVELYNLATYFARLDHVKVDFIVGDYGQEDVETWQNVTVRRVRYMREHIYKSLRHKVLRYLNFFRILLRQQSDIYMTKTASELLGWMVLFVKLLKGKKVIFRLASDKDAEPEFWKPSGRLYHLYKFGLRNSDLIYVQTEDQKKMLKDNCGMDGRVLKNIFPVGSVNEQNSKQYILWVSRCEPLKRPELFIELARKLPEENFVMIMPHMRKADEDDNAYDDRMTEVARKTATELNNFEFHEFVPFHQIQHYYDNAKLFVNTSEYEGFPNSFIQSCMGKTGILSFRVNPDGFLTKYGIGCCCGDDMDKAVGYIRGLDCHMIRQQGENACEYVKQNHDVDRIGKIYMEDFIKLLNWKAESRCFL